MLKDRRYVIIAVRSSSDSLSMEKAGMRTPPFRTMSIVCSLMSPAREGPTTPSAFCPWQLVHSVLRYRARPAAIASGLAQSMSITVEVGFGVDVGYGVAVVVGDGVAVGTATVAEVGVGVASSPPQAAAATNSTMARIPPAARIIMGLFITHLLTTFLRVSILPA